MARTKLDALVVGAGAAGLAAARELSNAGLSATIVEARDRIGGRVFTLHDRNSPLPIELGAEFVHGEAPQTFAIIRAAGLTAAELSGTHYWSRNGRFSSRMDFWRRLEDVRKKMSRAVASGKKDLSLDDFLNHNKIAPKTRQMMINFVQGYHAGHPEKISVRSLVGGDDEEQPDSRQFRIVNGYDAVVHWLRDGMDPEKVELRLNTIATEIIWKPRHVSIHCSSRTGATLDAFEAHAAIVTVPHAVLKARGLLFRPDLTQKQNAVQRLEAGQICKMIFRFRHAFWEEDDFLRKRLEKGVSSSEGLAFAHASDADVPVWWTTMPCRSPLLTAWVGGPKADLLLNENEQDRIEKALNALSKVFAVPRRVIDELLESWAMHDWRSDPFSRGAYMYIPVGSMNAQAALGKPVEQTLFFAGEATDFAEMGTVTGAIKSGRRAAQELIRALPASVRRRAALS